MIEHDKAIRVKRIARALSSIPFGKLFSLIYRRLFSISDYERWTDAQELNPTWDSRTRQIARLIPDGTKVVEFGAGRCQLESLLPSRCTYFPFDLVARGPSTIVCDLNKKPLPDIGRFDVAVFGGVLEYVFDLKNLIAWLAPRVEMCVVSYACVQSSFWPCRFLEISERVKLGWVNHYREEEVITLFSQAGFACLHAESWNSQRIFAFRATTSGQCIA